MAEPYVAIVYNPGSLLHHAQIVSDSAVDFEAACLNEAAQGYAVFDASHLVWDLPFPQPIETINGIIAKAEGVPVESLPSGRCAVVHPTTRMVTAPIIADPDRDVIPPGHPLATKSLGRELHASEDAKIGDKITPEGERLARVVTADQDGKVEAVEWVDPKAIPAGYVEESTAAVGDTVEELKAVAVETTGAEPL